MSDTHNNTTVNAAAVAVDAVINVVDDGNNLTRVCQKLDMLVVPIVNAFNDLMEITDSTSTTFGFVAADTYDFSELSDHLKDAVTELESAIEAASCIVECGPTILHKMRRLQPVIEALGKIQSEDPVRIERDLTIKIQKMVSKF